MTINIRVKHLLDIVESKINTTIGASSKFVTIAAYKCFFINAQSETEILADDAFVSIDIDVSLFLSIYNQYDRKSFGEVKFINGEMKADLQPQYIEKIIGSTTVKSTAEVLLSGAPLSAGLISMVRGQVVANAAAYMAEHDFGDLPDIDFSELEEAILSSFTAQPPTVNTIPGPSGTTTQEIVYPEALQQIVTEGNEAQEVVNFIISSSNEWQELNTRKKQRGKDIMKDIFEATLT